MSRLGMVCKEIDLVTLSEIPMLQVLTVILSLSRRARLRSNPPLLNWSVGESGFAVRGAVCDTCATGEDGLYGWPSSVAAGIFCPDLEVGSSCLGVGNGKVLPRWGGC